MNNTLFVITGFTTSFAVVWAGALLGEPRSVWMMEQVEKFLLKVLNEIEKESLTVRFSEELLQVITNN